MSRHIWTKEETKYLVEIAPGHSRQKITELMNKKFNCSFTLSQVTNKMQHIKLNNGIEN